MAGGSWSGVSENWVTYEPAEMAKLLPPCKDVKVGLRYVPEATGVPIVVKLTPKQGPAVQQNFGFAAQSDAAGALRDYQARLALVFGRAEAGGSATRPR